MDKYRELRDRLSALNKQPMTLMSGVVKKVDGLEVVVQMGSTEVTAQLRATAIKQDGQILMTPAVDSAVVVGSLSGDLTQLVVLAMDRCDKIEMKGEVVLNGGQYGGMVQVEELTSKLNELVNAFNTHTHPHPQGQTSAPTTGAKSFVRSDYENTKVKH